MRVDQLCAGRPPAGRGDGSPFPAAPQHVRHRYVPLSRHGPGRLSFTASRSSPSPRVARRRRDSRPRGRLLWKLSHSRHVGRGLAFGASRQEADRELRLIPNVEIRGPTATLIPFYCVDAVCEMPAAATRATCRTSIFRTNCICGSGWKPNAIRPPTGSFWNGISSARWTSKSTWTRPGAQRMDELRRQELHPDK